VRVAVPRLPRIANFDDLDPLMSEPGLSVEIVPPGRALPGDAALVVLPGSKATIADLRAVRAEGWDVDIRAHVRRGGRVLGLCGGYQMLGRRIEDPGGVEGPPGGVEGLGLLDVTTIMAGEKRLARVAGSMGGAPIAGYEMHMGRTEGPDAARPWLLLDGRPEGAMSPDGRVRGTYLHGLLASGPARAALLHEIGAPSTGAEWGAEVEGALDALGAHVARALDLDALLALAR
jgi:adenosylcobyric acid synthase